MKIKLLDGREQSGYTTFGAVWARGETGKDAAFRLIGEDGAEVPVQSKVTAWWPDGSVKWSAHTADAGRMGRRAELLCTDAGVQSARNVENAAAGQPACGNAAGAQQTGLRIEEQAERICIDTGKVKVEIPAGSALPADSLIGALYYGGRLQAKAAYPVFRLERRSGYGAKMWESDQNYGVGFGTAGKKPNEAETGQEVSSEVSGNRNPGISPGNDSEKPCETVVGAAGAAKAAENTKPDAARIAADEAGGAAPEISEFTYAEERRVIREFRGEIREVVLEERGPEQAVVRFRGWHVGGSEGTHMPFVIRLYLWKGSEELRFSHTFLFDGVESRDFLKGMGIRFVLPMEGELYDRHIQYRLESFDFHENAVILNSSHPRMSPEALARQQAGERVAYGPDTPEGQGADKLPVWQRFVLFQDGDSHYSVRKQTHPDCFALTGRQGRRARGVMAVTDATGGMSFGIRDFWQRYPSGLEVCGLAERQAACTLWFYCPEAEAFDFRHYDKKSYPATCYEGFEETGASAYGIGVTSECRVRCQRTVPASEELEAFAAHLNKPPVYAAEPAYYHEKRAFGYWGEKQTRTDGERWLEGQLEKAFRFYADEVEARSWYGLFDYGDVMHSYDGVRHCWKYDQGGFAWQNTELVPTYWLWLYFLRTGREDVFSLAEAMTRHCSEVDVYHFGPLKGLGSRHNVRHWGCSCKEPRIGMAGHNRFLYYLTGDARLGDVMDDAKDADLSMVNLPHAKHLEADGTERVEVRSGPDWSSFVSNWMTAYERTLNPIYRDKILQGLGDIVATPFGLMSGPDYNYDAEHARLLYRGEIESTPNQHLQICMGGLQVWLETADMLQDDRLKELLARLGAFYYLPREEKRRLTGGKIDRRAFSCRMLASGTAAFGAFYGVHADAEGMPAPLTPASGEGRLNRVDGVACSLLPFTSNEAGSNQSEGCVAEKTSSASNGKCGDGSGRNLPASNRSDAADGELAVLAWQELLGDIVNRQGLHGFETQPYAETGDGKTFEEISWVTTNTTAQWCLNAMMALEFVRGYLPEQLEGITRMLLPENQSKLTRGE